MRSCCAWCLLFPGFFSRHIQKSSERAQNRCWERRPHCTGMLALRLTHRYHSKQSQPSGKVAWANRKTFVRALDARWCGLFCQMVGRAGGLSVVLDARKDTPCCMYVLAMKCQQRQSGARKENCLHANAMSQRPQNALHKAASGWHSWKGILDRNKSPGGHSTQCGKCSWS